MELGEEAALQDMEAHGNCLNPSATGKKYPDLSLRLTFTFLRMAPTDLT